MQRGRRKTLLPARSQRVPPRPSSSPPWTQQTPPLDARLCVPPPPRRAGADSQAPWCFHQLRYATTARTEGQGSGIGNFPRGLECSWPFVPGWGGLFTICWWLQPRQVLLNRQKATIFRPRVEEGPDGQTWRLSGCRRSATPDVSSCGSNFLPAPT